MKREAGTTMGQWTRRVVIAVVLGVHTVALIWSAYRHSPCTDEVGHLPAGVTHWHVGCFDLYRVNPPLVRMIAALSVVLAGVDVDCVIYADDPTARAEFGAGQRLIRVHGDYTFWLFTIARWACVPFSLVGAYVCLRWASELYGPTAGLLALVLWCTCPNILGHGALLTPDCGAAALGVTAAYCFWRWLRAPTIGNALGAGITLGLAELTKFTWVVLFVLWPLLWLIWRWSERAREPYRWMRDEAIQAGMMLFVCLVTVNGLYGCEGSMTPLGSIPFVSQTLSGVEVSPSWTVSPGNRFSGTVIGHIPVPLPRNYIQGIDVQKWDYERGRWSFLRGEWRHGGWAYDHDGEWRHGGWWYYYLYAIAVKVPLGTLLLVVLAGAFAARYGRSWRDELVLIAPALVVLVLVSSQTGFNHHLRYVLPMFPFVFVWISKLGRAWDVGDRKVACVVAAALVWTCASSISVYPHSLSYFNELAGGPRNGHYHLVDSNSDWGQDLIYLREWREQHSDAEPFYVHLVCPYDLAWVGLESSRPPHEPAPGWYAISVHELHERHRRYEWLLEGLEPDAMMGYSIYVYHVDLAAANQARRERGLPELTEADVRQAEASAEETKP
jgi:hypothetical protein